MSNITALRHRPCSLRPRSRRVVFAALIGLLLATAGWADIASQRMIAPGVSYTRLWRGDGPYNINIVEVDPRQQYISFACVGGEAPKRQVVGEFARATSTPDSYAVAAVNGDFFQPGGINDGALLGVNINAGRLVSARTFRSSFVVLERGVAQIASLRLDAWLETADGRRIPLQAVNRPRLENDIVLYTPLFGASTRTTASGREIVLSGVSSPLELGKPYATQVLASTHAVGNLGLWPEQVAVSASGAMAAEIESLKVGDTLKLCVDLQPRLPGKIVHAMGGGPRLLRDGRVSVDWRQEQFRPGFAPERHPRTALGIKPDGHVLLVTVDGRQTGSIGMTLDELAQLMLDLGCRDAMNLDGGGSTTMWVRGEIANWPSDGARVVQRMAPTASRGGADAPTSPPLISGGKPRKVGNALMVMSAAPHGPATRLRLTPEAITALPGYGVTIRAQAEDDYYNPVETSATGVRWSCDTAVGAVTASGLFTTADTTGTATGAVTATVGAATATLPITVYARPTTLRISPQTVTGAPGAKVRFALLAVDAEGRVIEFDATRVTWQVDPAAGVMEQPGVLTVGSDAGGNVTATLCGVTATAQVTAESAAIEVESAE